MNDELRKIRQLIRLMKNQGVLTLKLPELELEIAPQAIKQKPIKSKPNQSTQSQIDIPPQYSSEEVMAWSIPGLMGGQ